METGTNGVDTLDPPPLGTVELEKAVQVLKGKVFIKGNLDPVNKHRVLECLIECAEQRNATFVLVTHDHDLLNRFDRVIDVKSFSSSGSPPKRHVLD